MARRVRGSTFVVALVTAMVQVQFLAEDLPHAAGTAEKRKART